MKIKSLISVLLCAMIFSACFHPNPPKIVPNITADTLHYTYHVIKERAEDCGNKPDSGCSVAMIKYPVFNNQDVLNDSVTQKILTLFDAHPDKDLQTRAKRFIGEYVAFKKTKKHSLLPFSLNLYGQVVRQDSSLLTLETGGSTFSGNAHPIEQTIFTNWNTAAQKQIDLDDIFIRGYLSKLTKIADSIFRKNENLKDTSSLARDYFFKGNKFSLNNNFLITPLGIRFLYNEYEIKPYAAGTTNLFIPYITIKTLLKPHTVVSQYIK
ncbi:hypothetical protein BEL04_15845 [Mucilaginibacter sp. PPCGB 2223]|uniref:DUF3298 and DUF4163 domain-containing protein n=1 Tax=Mucilaginibacter sp. PPCGB 2223 TaxID=1886027 RepID=UPI00082560F2|nr:DUF3298 and DUF4163 domain-containing protein [Mucilaginibacter sp. PPCGB 2223]OCX51496.1 hypothetical protein BEL04_15845 [Mucilaginibacter sp. PPCGB 2223]